MEYVIETKKLTKSYGTSRGIIDVDLSISAGEIFGFIGPNGAGKSTTIRTLLSLIHKTSGDAYIFGLDCEKNKEKILTDVGYLPSEVFYYDNMRALNLLEYSASFYKKDCTKRIHELADALELDLTKKIEDMSLGNKKKVGIIQGLLHSPKLIILDEPTSGLDPLMQKKFFDIIKEENSRGATVLFSSHILSEVQKICNRVAIIKNGRIVKVQRVDELLQNSYKKVSFVLKNAEDATRINHNFCTNYEISENTVSFIYRGDCNLLIHEISNYDITTIEITEPSLEEVFMHYYAE